MCLRPRKVCDDESLTRAALGAFRASLAPKQHVTRATTARSRKMPQCTNSASHPIRLVQRYCAACYPHCSPPAPPPRHTHEPTYIETRNQMTAKTLRFSQLSASRQALVRLCQDINFGQIQDLHIRNSDPVWGPAPTVLSEIKLDTEDAPRPENELPDFKLSSEVKRLMSQLDQLKDGKIERIEVRAGVPKRMVFISESASKRARRTPPCVDPV